MQARAPSGSQWSHQSGGVASLFPRTNIEENGSTRHCVYTITSWLLSVYWYWARSLYQVTLSLSFYSGVWLSFLMDLLGLRLVLAVAARDYMRSSIQSELSVLIKPWAKYLWILSKELYSHWTFPLFLWTGHCFAHWYMHGSAICLCHLPDRADSHIDIMQELYEVLYGFVRSGQFCFNFGWCTDTLVKLCQ